MKSKRKVSGFQRKYLFYNITLLFLALLISCLSVVTYMVRNQTTIVTDKYAYYNEKAGISLDNLYKKTDEVTADCIVNDMVQESLRVTPLSDVEKNTLGKYFAYMNLDYISEYCYVDNKKNVYTRSYTKLLYNTFNHSGMKDKLGDSYAKTVWFISEDKLFDTNDTSLYVGRKVHSLNYANKVGYLFIKMNSDFLHSILDVDNEYSKEVATGILDNEGHIVASNFPEGFVLNANFFQLPSKRVKALLLIIKKYLVADFLFISRKKAAFPSLRLFLILSFIRV